MATAPQIVRFEVNGQVNWRVAFDQKSGCWVGVCDALLVTAEAETWGKLCRTIDEIQNELFRDLLQDNELDAFLRQHGWVPLNPIPRHVSSDEVIFDLPTHIVPEAHGQARAAYQ